MASPDLLLPGAAVTLRIPPHRALKHLTGRPGAVVSVADETVGGRTARFCVIHVDDGSEAGIEVRDVPAGYLAPARARQKRRSPLNLHTPRDTRSEAARQAEGVAWLRKHGYTVLEVGKGRKGVTCPVCSRFFFPRGWQGNDPGVPDTLVTRDTWPIGCALQMEWKDGEKGHRTTEQAALEATGRIVIAWDLPSCRAAVERFEQTQQSFERAAVAPLLEV